MEAFKSIITSKTIIANVLTAVASIAAIWGFSMSPENQAIAVSVIVALGTAISSAFRVSSTQQLVGSSEVADEANIAMRTGVLPETALIKAKAKVAANKQGREVR